MPLIPSVPSVVSKALVSPRGGERRGCQTFWRALNLGCAITLLPPLSFPTSSHDWHQALQTSTPTWHLSLSCAASGGRITNPHQAPEALLGPCSDTRTQPFHLLPCSAILQPGHPPVMAISAWRWLQGPFQDQPGLCFLSLGGIPDLLRPLQINSNAFPILPERDLQQRLASSLPSQSQGAAQAAALACLGEELRPS